MIKVKLTDGPLKGDIVTVTDLHIKQGFIKVAEKMSLKNLKMYFSSDAVVDSVSTYVYLIDREADRHGIPTGRISVRYSKE